MRIAYFDCFSGISGDMTIGAFLDAGLKLKTLSKELAKLKLTGYELSARRVKRGGITGTKFDVALKAGARHGHRSLSEILRLIDSSTLSRRVKEDASAIFTVIGRAEAKIHGVKESRYVRFHEVGDIDSIVDIVGAAIAREELGIEKIYASPLPLGRTFVDVHHGKLPVPAPATLEILKGVPSAVTGTEAELVTPTGAGIVKALALSFGAPPAMKIERIGYGAGSRELEGMPNMLRLVTGKAGPAREDGRIVVIETNIDDMPPNHFEYVFERLFKEGALDAFVTNIQMKKSRPAFKLTVLAKPGHLEAVRKTIFEETTAIGMRYYEVERFTLDRKSVPVKTKYGTVKIKLSGCGNDILTASPEYEDCVRIARSRKIPLKAVHDEAKRGFRV